jgi:flagellar biosynthetic protein FliR
MEITNSSITLFTNMAISVLVLAIKMASPVLIALFLTNLSLALLARIAPQTNIFILSFQLKVSVGLIVLLISIPLFVYVSKIAMEGMQQELYRFILTLYPDRV